ncbi:MAG: hypothetical protein M3O15_08950 [Acidobacteriota bacterium]|nr:hypothetical protein [Acidobacteriota bacterium]
MSASRGGAGGLTPEAFAALLAALDPDPEKAGRGYEELRRRLVRFLEWRGARAPEELADETQNRVGRRLAGGLRLHSDDLYPFAAGVARLVLYEDQRRREREQRTFEEACWLPPTGGFDPADDRSLDCLERCLGRLPPERRRHILIYHGDGNRIANRKALCDELGIPINALRIRMLRLRDSLRVCVVECLRLGPS